MVSEKFMDKKSILIFGVGELQRSIIRRANAMGLFTVGIDPCEDASSRDECCAFEVVGGQDYEGTLAIAKKYDVSAIVTAATDKPLVMMARIAEEMGLKFFSEETAIWSTDKFKMKQRFLEGGISCARGKIIKSVDEVLDFNFPLILKPRDNSGSRGVILCRDIKELSTAISETFQYTHMDSVLVEEYIEGCEYSIESLHYDGKSHVVQFTEKHTTPFPYNVELEHIQPADLSEELKKEIFSIVEKIGKTFKFENCPSHTELKINGRGIYVIETSPRLGGDYITSDLTPLSTGINIEDQLLNIAVGNPVDITSIRNEKASAVHFFSFPEGVITHIDPQIDDVNEWDGIVSFDFKLKQYEKINKISSSLNRYGQFVVCGENRETVENYIEKYSKAICNFINIKQE